MDHKDTALIFTYKMTDEDTANLIKLRASNEALFTGKRNASKIAWRAVIKEMGLQGKVTSGQASKKWENLKKKYKELKFPPGGLAVGGDVSGASWHWFYLMNEAMEGRLSTSAPVLSTASYGEDEPDSPGGLAPRPPGRKRRREEEKSEMLEFLTAEAAREECLGMELKEGDAVEMYVEREEAERQRVALETEQERAGLHMQGVGFERELAVMDRERAGLEREKAALERGRAALERERAGLERERAALEKDRAGVERERAGLERDWTLLEKERCALERERAALHRNGPPELKQDSPALPLDPDALQRRERFLSLFEKLIEKL